MQYNTQQENELHSEHVLQLNNEQRIAYDTIVHSIDTLQPTQFFIQGSVDVEKHFYINVFATTIVVKRR